MLDSSRPFAYCERNAPGAFVTAWIDSGLRSTGMHFGSSDTIRLFLRSLCAIVSLQSCVFSVVAQRGTALSADSALPEVFTLGPGQCRKFRLGLAELERQVYFVQSEVTSRVRCFRRITHCCAWRLHHRGRRECLHGNTMQQT